MYSRSTEVKLRRDLLLLASSVINPSVGVFSYKGRLMDAVESSYIFRETKLYNQLNNKLTVKHNIIFETILI